MRLGPLPRMMTFLRSVGAGLVFFLVRRVEIGRVAFELSGTGVDPLEYRAHVVFLAQLMNLLAGGAAIF